MKSIIIALLVILGAQSVVANEDLNLTPSFPNFNPEFEIIEEDPGPDALIKDETIHKKTLVIDGTKTKVKWTELGYGMITEKIIIPELAGSTVFNHRNSGEEGPCLRSFRFMGAEAINMPEEFSVDISIMNRYEINEEKVVCRVTMIEDVETVIEGVSFVHTYSKPMGFRHPDDCL